MQNNSKKIKEIVREEGKFEDFQIPVIENVKIQLVSHRVIEKSTITGKVLKESPFNYTIWLDFSSFNHGLKDDELSEKIRIAANMKFPLYKGYEKKYYYYTNDYMDSESKMNILKSIIKIAQEYADEKKDEVFLMKKELKQDYESNKVYETRELLMLPYKAPGVEPCYVVVAKDMLEPSVYGIIARASTFTQVLSKDKEVNETRHLNAHVSDIKKYFPDFRKKGRFFIIAENRYDEIKALMLSRMAKEVFESQEQKKFSENIDKSSVEWDKPNIFGVSIKYLEEKGTFLFTGKGLLDGSSLSKRTLVPLWANNFIYMENVSPEDRISSKEFYIENSNKIELNILKGGNALNGFEVPISDIDKLKTIIKNLEKELQIWGREELLIDIEKSVDVEGAWTKDYPIVYISGKDAFLCFSARQNYKKLPKDYDKNTGDLYITNRSQSVKIDDSGLCEIQDVEMYVSKVVLKGFKITAKEAEHFLTEHPFAMTIKDQSIRFNARIDLKNSEYTNVVNKNSSWVNELFDMKFTALMMSDDMKIETTKKAKKLKF